MIIYLDPLNLHLFNVSTFLYIAFIVYFIVSSLLFICYSVYLIIPLHFVDTKYWVCFYPLGPSGLWYSLDLAHPYKSFGNRSVINRTLFNGSLSQWALRYSDYGYGLSGGKGAARARLISVPRHFQYSISSRARLCLVFLLPTVLACTQNKINFYVRPLKFIQTIYTL